MKEYVFLIFVIMCVFLLMYYRIQKMNAFTDYGDIIKNANNFTNSQYLYFRDFTNKGLDINKDLNIGLLNNSLRQPEMHLPKSLDKDFTSHFSEDPSEKYRDYDNKICKLSTSPKDFPKDRNTIACGWYFYDNSDVGSFGTIGTREGPLFIENIPPGGEWIWNIDTAIQKEEIKDCMRVKSCELISSIDQLRGKCGFCNNKGYSVPITDNGLEKYPFLESSCGDKLILNPELCSTKQPIPILTTDGTSCGMFGVPSPDNTRRLYTKEDCDSLTGTFMSNGDCVSNAGLIFNDECRQLNTPEVLLKTNSVKTISKKKTTNTDIQSILPSQTDFFAFQSSLDKAEVQNDLANQDICSPTKDGRLTPSCLISIAKGIGLKDAGLIITLLKYGSKPDENGKMALEIIINSGIQLTQSVLGRGDIDRDSAANVFNEVYKSMTQGKTQLIKAAATILVTGNYDLFDPCNDLEDSSYAKSLICLQRAFRQAGCQASGSAYPTQSSIRKYANMALSDIMQFFGKLYDDMNTKNPFEQDSAVSQCLGLKYYRKENQYKKYKDHNTTADNLKCYTDNKSADFCHHDCNKDPTCTGYIYVNPNTQWGVNSGCCLKTLKNNSNATITPSLGIDYYQKMMPEAKPKNLGCFQDAGDRAFPNYHGRFLENAFDKCYKIAWDKGHDTFSLQANGYCFTGNNPRYDKHGPATNCSADGTGGDWANQVYTIDFFGGKQQDTLKSF